MIEAFVINKINQERQIFDELWGSLPVDEKLTPEKIAKSSLSEFTKNYILNIVEEAGDRDEILDRIAKANKLRFNYAIRPKWTLITYLFGNYESRPPTDIAKKLEEDVRQYSSIEIWTNSTALAVFSDKKIGISRSGKEYILTYS